MKVYTVNDTLTYYPSGKTYGVFSTKEKAEEFAENLSQHPYEVEITEHELDRWPTPDELPYEFKRSYLERVLSKA